MDANATPLKESDLWSAYADLAQVRGVAETDVPIYVA